MNKLAYFALALAAFFAAGCSKAPPTALAAKAHETTYEVRGILRGINFAERSAMVEHEEIPGYMPAMTMPFDLKSMAEVEALKAGDGMKFQLVVTDKSSWITGVQKIDAGEVRLPKAGAAASSAPAVERLKEGDALPAFQLVDQQGRALTAKTFAGKPLLLTFIFTRCPIPNYCPRMSNHFRTIREQLGSDPARAEQTQYLSISFDTEFDTPEQLTAYAQRYGADGESWRFATGTREQIEKLTAAFSVYVKPESGTLSHGLCTALVGPDGMIHKLWRGNSWEPAEVVAALRNLTPDSALTEHAR